MDDDSDRRPATYNGATLVLVCPDNHHLGNLIQTSTNIVLYEPGWEASVPYPWEQHLDLLGEDTPADSATESIKIKIFRLQCDSCEGCPEYYGYEQPIKDALSQDDTLLATYTLEFCES